MKGNHGRAKPRVAAVVGSTASGKTSLAIALAKAFDGEIISCDSMQIYRYMDVGTAKPTPEEQSEIPHHLIDFFDPTDPQGYSCADYVRDARAVADDIISRGKLPILCGGTGLYLDAFLRGGSFQDTQVDQTLRDSLLAYAETQGAEALHAMLRELDPEAAETIHPNNVKRVIRAIEICRTTGRTKTDLDRASQEVECPYDALVVGIRYQNRQTLYRRIENRVDEMIEAGLVEETRRLREMGVFETCPTAAQAIGYKELFPYLDGEATLAQATEILKTATRHYAKRQMTWFGAKKYVRWVDADEGEDLPPKEFEDIVNNAKKLFIQEGFCDII